MYEKEKKSFAGPKRGGQKFGGKGGGRGGFGDKPRGDRQDRPARDGARSERPYVKRDRDDSSSDRPRGKPFEKREFSSRDARPPHERSFGDKPYKKREFDSDKPRREYKPEGRKDFGDRDSRPPRDRSFGDKPYKKREFDSNAPRREYKPESRKDFGDRDSRPPRERSFGDKPYKKREFDGEKKPFDKDKRRERPQKSYERYGERPARPPRRDFSDNRPHSGLNEERGTANPETSQRLRSSRPSYGSPSPTYLYGNHAVTNALLNPKRVNKRLLCTQKSFESIQETWSEAQEDGLTLPEVITVEKEDIERLLPRDAVHQDILLDCQSLEETFLADILLTAPDDAKVIVLDQVTDPHNVGAILRSAAAFGAKAVIVQTLNAPEITGVLAKSASGAIEHVPIIREVNLSRALEQLKKAGFFCIGLAEEGKQTLMQLNLTGKTALVLGAEGAGLRRLVAENCDELVKLPTQSPIGSLNVSNAAAVALYELCRK